jgi:hypothetical protein
VITFAMRAESAHLSRIDIFPFILQISLAYIEVLTIDDVDLRPMNVSIPVEQFKATSKVRTMSNCERKNVDGFGETRNH